MTSENSCEKCKECENMKDVNNMTVAWGDTEDLKTHIKELHAEITELKKKYTIVWIDDKDIIIRNLEKEIAKRDETIEMIKIAVYDDDAMWNDIKKILQEK